MSKTIPARIRSPREQLVFSAIGWVKLSGIINAIWHIRRYKLQNNIHRKWSDEDQRNAVDYLGEMSDAEIREMIAQIREDVREQQRTMPQLRLYASETYSTEAH